MIKIVRPNSWDFGSPTVSLVDCHSHGIDGDWMAKMAAAEIFKDFEGLRPAPKHSLIHLIALGDADFYGMNKNADIFYKSARQLELPLGDWSRIKISPKGKEAYWEEKSADTFADRTHVGNLERANTFVTHGNVFKNHKNKPFERDELDPITNKPTGKKLPADKVFGHVKAAAHNDRMNRVELMIEVPHGPDWDDDLEKMANDQEIEFSMAGLVPFDICDACGHKAKKRENYCDHLRLYPTALLKSGHQIGAVNDWTTFFDISRVVRRADRIALGLMKVASELGGFMSGADLAFDPMFARELPIELLGMYQPTSVSRRIDILRKAAAIEKLVPMKGLKVNPRAVKSHKNPEAKKTRMEKLSQLRGRGMADLPDAFKVLADNGICLDVEDFTTLVMGTEKAAQIQELIKQATQLLPGIFQAALSNSEVSENTNYDPSRSVCSAGMRKVAGDLTADLSLEPEASGVRCVNNTIRAVPITAIDTGVDRNMGEPEAAARALALEYASYKLAFLDHISEHRPQFLDYFVEAAVVQNYYR